MKTKSIIFLFAGMLSISTLYAQQPKEQKTAYMVADAHLDTQWLWDIQKTITDFIPNTMLQNLHLLRTYPNYIFNFEGAVKYGWMKEYYPREYEEVKKYILNGRWHLSGTSWDASEAIICSSESVIRNTMLGQQYYRQEFGLESTDFFLPDCFGFPYNYPTIARHCGLIGFSSQKLQWRRTDHYIGKKLTKYPFTVGLWTGIDGSTIMMTHAFDYGKRYNNIDLSYDKQLYREMSESETGIGMRYYGTGDQGGAPSIASVQSVEKGLKSDGPVKIISATSDQIFKDYLPYENHPELPRFKGELHMERHGVGCYTSQAAVKLYNRQCEHLADAAERSSLVAEVLGRRTYPTKTLNEIWGCVITNQFHDVLPGTSIPKVYEYAWNDNIINMRRFSDITASAVSGVSELLDTRVSGTPLVLFNPEGFTHKSVADVTMPSMADAYTVTDPNGRVAESQVVTDSRGEKHLLINSTVPSTGFAVYSAKAEKKTSVKTDRKVSDFENSVYKVSFNADGNISSILDKRYNKELVAPGSAIGLVVLTETTSEEWPAWEILKETIDGHYVVVKDRAEVRLIEDGALRKTVKVTKRYGASLFAQYIRLYEGNLADRIDVYNEVEWKSQNALLKCDFPLSVSNPVATYDLGLGSIERCNNETFKYEVYSHEWTDLTDASGDYGVTFLNDCKYGWDKPADNQLRLSLLWSPTPAQSFDFQARQDIGHHEFTYSIIGHKGALDKGLAFQQSTQLNSPLRSFVAPKHAGELGREYSFLKCDNPQVTVRAFKKAEKSDEYVLRVYDNSGSAQKASVQFDSAISQAFEADGTEKTLGSASFSGNSLDIDIPAFGVKTYKLQFAASREVLQPAGTSIDLPWNKYCFSYNDYRAAANFEKRHSYAAELMPADGLTVDGIHFQMQDMNHLSGYECSGDTIQIPVGAYNRFYILAASTEADQQTSLQFLVPAKKGYNVVEANAITVPYYTGFYGQWEHPGQTVGFCKNAEIAYVGTHRHHPLKDMPYEYTYMFKYGFDVPQGATHIVLPNNKKVVVFSATGVKESPLATPACKMFTTGNK